MIITIKPTTTHLQSHYELREITVIALRTGERTGQTIVDMASTMVAPTFIRNQQSNVSKQKKVQSNIPQPLRPSSDPENKVLIGQNVNTVNLPLVRGSKLSCLNALSLYIWS